MRTGIADVPLDWGHCPPWLFERMTKLGRGIIIAIVEEFGPAEVLKRLSDPIWFQSLGCVMGFDWNSSGLTVTTMGALKEAVRGFEQNLGLYICGGKKVSRNTPLEIQQWGQKLGFSCEQTQSLENASRSAAKVDSSLVQDGFSIYAHNLIFINTGQWAVIQQGMNINIQKARRYHWLSDKVKDFCEEPHTGIVSDVRQTVLNLTAKESRQNKDIASELVKEEPRNFLDDIKKIAFKENRLSAQRRLPGFAQMELNDIEFHWHPVANEKFDIKRLAKIIGQAHSVEPQNFNELVMLPGVGPKTIRALSLAAEIIYGAKPSYEDPARYTFAVGGKDGTPFPVDCQTYDKMLNVMEKGIGISKVSLKEKENAKYRLETITYPF